MPATAPTLTTDRLLLRGHRLDDFEDYAAMLVEPAFYRYITGRPIAHSEAWSRLLRYAGHWALLGFGYWVICDRASGEYLGDVGFADYQREIEPPFGDMPEIGWGLKTAAHGCGLATEAVTAVVAWGDQHFAAQATACMIHPDNVASIRVAEKAGYQLWTKTTFSGDPTWLYRRQPPD